MRTKRNHPDTLTRQLRGCQVSHVSVPDEQHLLVHFSNGLVLAIERGSQALTASVDSSCWATGRNAEQARPTQRQVEYLRFHHTIHWAIRQGASGIGHTAALSGISALGEPDDADPRTARFH